MLKVIGGLVVAVIIAMGVVKAIEFFAPKGTKEDKE